MASAPKGHVQMSTPSLCSNRARAHHSGTRLFFSSLPPTLEGLRLGGGNKFASLPEDCFRLRPALLKLCGRLRSCSQSWLLRSRGRRIFRLGDGGWGGAVK
jgi:hypothetical protein